MTREEFWQRVFISALRKDGYDSAVACQAADNALSELDRRQKEFKK